MKYWICITHSRSNYQRVVNDDEPSDYDDQEGEDQEEEDDYDEASQQQEAPPYATQDRRPVKAACERIRTLVESHFADYCVFPQQVNPNLWFAPNDNVTKLFNLGEENLDRFETHSWWGPPKDLPPNDPDDVRAFRKDHFKLLRKGASAQIKTPAPINLISFRDEEFYNPKPVTESKLPPELFVSPASWEFKDSPFSKVGHHMINNARISSEIFTLVELLKMTNNPVASQSLSPEQKKG